MSKKNIIVIGNGMVGYKFLEKFRETQNQDYNLITFCEEDLPAYDRVHLSEYFSDLDASKLSLSPLQWYENNNITIHMEDGVTKINRENKTVESKKGITLSYDVLVMATGSAPFVPPLSGVDKKGVFVYRTIKDLESIVDYSKQCQKSVVIGGGLLGLEAAKAMIDLNLNTSVVEFAPRLMPRQICTQGSNTLIAKIKELGVDVLLEKSTTSINGNGKVIGMSFSDDSSIDTDMIVISAGIRPRDELAKDCGIILGPRGGIEVNANMQTSDENIYAIGECAYYNGMIYGLVAPGYSMAETAVKNILGKKESFEGSDMSTKLKLMGVDVASIGDSVSENKDFDTVESLNTKEGIYKKLIIDKKENLLKGAVLVGDASDYNNLLQLYKNQMALPENIESLIFKSSGDDNSAAGVDALPDEAQICSCENVSKAGIKEAIANGCDDINKIKKCTKAGTGCGSCVTLVKDILDSEIKKSGGTVNNSLCEHFTQAREELFLLVRNNQHTSFEEVLQKYGKGKGCEICKPAIASILASTRNDHVLNHDQIQDTNDAYMANIQKNGTYSVIPRVPGGEIFPDQLIAIGEVAKEFDLYAKITGGQRIDLLGAHLNDLPAIWSKLVTVGLETGHAYAKSLRTVKSCVGQAWCRFGVGDSTALAIEVENRYKGLRSPHKIKMAVSGCARECAEAQSKDVGIIATENGWNLYICGNGGMKPQHAVLIGSDLNKEELINAIDIFLMYYVRTADRLTRTATWLNKLDGGIEHLKDVVFNDSLGINNELLADMQHIVNTYQCEWKTTIESPQQLKRFKSFVNSPDKDDNIKMSTNRGQLQPATV
jgi:nitrite reductase (NADH) large subunit